MCCRKDADHSTVSPRTGPYSLNALIFLRRPVHRRETLFSRASTFSRLKSGGNLWSVPRRFPDLCAGAKAAGYFVGSYRKASVQATMEDGRSRQRKSPQSERIPRAGRTTSHLLWFGASDPHRTCTERQGYSGMKAPRTSKCRPSILTRRSSAKTSSITTGTAADGDRSARPQRFAGRGG